MLLHEEIIPKNQAKNKQSQEIVGDAERGKEGEKEKRRKGGRDRETEFSGSNLGLEPNLPKGIFWIFHVHFSCKLSFVIN